MKKNIRNRLIDFFTGVGATWVALAFTFFVMVSLGAILQTVGGLPDGLINFVLVLVGGGSFTIAYIYAMKVDAENTYYTRINNFNRDVDTPKKEHCLKGWISGEKK